MEKTKALTVNYGLPLLLFLISFILYLKSNFIVSWDLSEYLASAVSLLNGSLHNGDTRPGFITILAATLFLTHNSINAVMLLITGYSALLASFIFVICKQLSNTRVALPTTLLWIFTPALIYWLPRHIDSLWPLTFLLSCYFLLRLSSQPEKKVIFGCLSGIALGFTLTIKASVLPLVLFPFIAIFFLGIPYKVIKQYLLSCYLSLILFTLCLQLLLTTISGEYLYASETFKYPLNLLQEFSLTHLVEFTKVFIFGLYAYFFKSSVGVGLNHYIPFMPIMLLSLAYITLIAGKVDRRLFLLPILFVLNTFHMSISGLYNLRPSQDVLVIVILYISFGISLNHLIKVLFKKLTLSMSRNVTTISLLLVMTCCLVLTYPFTNNKNYLKQSWIFHQPKNLTTELRGQTITKEFIANTSTEIMMWDSPSANGIYIMTNGAKSIHKIPFWVLGDYLHFPGFKSTPVDHLANDIFYIDSLSPLAYNQRVFFLLSYAELKHYIEQHHIEFLIINNQPLLTKWLDQFPGVSHYKTIIEKKTEFKIYQVNPDWPAALTNELMITDFAKTFVNDIKNDPLRFAWYQQKYNKLFEDAGS